jgi:hypothetical protein
MLALVPLLMSGLAFGVVSLLIFITAVVILTIPVFATRGQTQMIWLGISGFLLLVIGVTLVVLTVLVGQGEIFQSTS